ncbi:MAG TPA: CSLREA domain-containing protein [Herpetosiphon sp.]|uniref:Polymorphic outer membrane protein n=1 Tax=Herpetosiphon aurantiacus (strain ATCC 23779 / DSM 785 / 114-95) TaxID=316274 RepID=A9B1S2_HERA2|nr:CSLREA domain-containing protein [Herpetosiphon sp.]ABX05364.1 polymorphic outer membrane protein [Herpetosiphon aurantiacus DSM 785]HBW51161.1 CSLREA domain-containing protein [Herpetosiphon sp.]
MHLKTIIGLGSMLLGLATAGIGHAQQTIATQAAASIFTVTTFNDEVNQNGQCSLREAIVAANTNSVSADCGNGALVTTINLASGTYTLNIDNPAPVGTEFRLDDNSGLYGDLDITDTLSLVGAAPNLTIISGLSVANTNRILHIHSGTVNLSNLSLIEAHSPWNGAAIYNQGQLTINNVNLNNNQTVLNLNYNDNLAALHGGAIYNAGSLSISNSALIGNRTAATLHDFNGGAIYNTAQLTINAVDFRQNQAVNGGAIYSTSTDQQLSISTSEFTDNEAIIVNDNEDPQGGALWLNSTKTISNTIFRSNEANAGGAIYALKALTINTSIFDRNAAGSGNGIAHGTAIHSKGQSNINRSIFKFNAGDSAAIGNAGTMQLDRATIINNSNRAIEFMGTAPIGTGGGVHNTNQLTIINSTISNNTANLAGAGIYNSRSLHLINTSVISNGIKFGDEDGVGGGIYTLPASTSYLTNTLISLNTAPAGADCWGATQGFYALISELDDCQLAGNTNLGDLAAQTSPLTQVDDYTWVAPLTQTSPAVDAGNNQACPASDQRGQSRPIDGNGDLLARCDLGAYEFVSTQTFYHQFAPWATR